MSATTRALPPDPIRSRAAPSSSLDAQFETKLVTNRVLAAEKPRPLQTERRPLHAGDPARRAGVSPVLNSGREKFVGGGRRRARFRWTSCRTWSRSATTCRCAPRADLLRHAGGRGDAALAQHLPTTPRTQGALQVLPAHEAA